MLTPLPMDIGILWKPQPPSATCFMSLSADSSEFPSDLRLELVKKGCADFANVQIHGSSDYLISAATFFPDYFLKDKATVSDKTALLDLMIFGVYFKETFGITPSVL